MQNLTYLYEFGAFVLNERSRELLRDSRPVSLLPKDFDVLLLLVKHAGEVIDKNVFRQTVWQSNHVTENSLSQSIHRIRLALDDASREPSYIETVSKRGYRLIAPVHGSNGRKQTESQGASPVAAEPTDERQTESRTGKHKRAVGLTMLFVCLLTAVLGLAGYSARKHRTRTPQFQHMKMARLTNGGTWVPSISPDGKFVAYTADAPNGRECIWIREVRTGHAAQLTPADGFNYSAHGFSRDGNYVYIHKADLHNQSDYFLGDLYRVPIIGGTPFKIAANVGGGIDTAPDDSRLVFVRPDLVNKENHLIVINADGTGEHVIATRKWPDISWVTSWSPDARLIAFCARSREGDKFYNTVMAVPAEGGPEFPLTKSHWLDVGGALWLPDGTGLLITAHDQASDPFQIYSISYPGGEVQRVTNDVNSYSALGITADGKTVVGEMADVSSNIWILPNGDSARARQITYGGKDGVGGLAWTPDGRIIYATMSRDGYSGTGASGGKALWTADAAGSNPERLTSGEEIDAHPGVTPDGRYVVFSSYQNGAWGIWRVDIDGHNPKQLAGGGTMTSPSCSPDGRWVVFRSGPLAAERVWRVSIEGGEAVKLSDRQAYAPSVSPDGKLVAFFSAGETKKNLVLIPATGGEPVKVFDNSPDTRYLLFTEVVRWTADGRLLTYIDNIGEVSNIWGEPIEGGAAQQLTKFDTGTIFSFAWSKDGRQLAVARGQYNRQIVLIEDLG